MQGNETHVVVNRGHIVVVVVVVVVVVNRGHIVTKICEHCSVRGALSVPSCLVIAFPATFAYH